MAWKPWFQQGAAVAIGHMKRMQKPIKRWDVIRGDWVQIMAGKDKGQQGKIATVMRKNQEVIVEGLNCEIVTRNDMRVLQVKPIPYRHVALVDPSDGEPCAVDYKYTADGQQVRVSTRTGQPIPKPIEAMQRKDVKVRSGYVDSQYDTSSDDATRRTYIPSLMSFKEEMELIYPTPPPMAELDIETLTQMKEHEEKLEQTSKK